MVKNYADAYRSIAVQVKDEHYFEDDDRHRLLEAIEEQAKNLSMQRGSDQHRLSDWLNAAEEVMPEIKKPLVKPMSMSGASETSSNNSGQLIGFLTVGTLLLSLAGGGGFAYMQLLAQVNAQAQEVKAMAEHIDELETAIKEIKPAESVVALAAEPTNKTADTNASAVAPLVDTRIKEQTKQLENLLDARFKQLIEHIDSRSANKPIITPLAMTSSETQAPPVMVMTTPVAAVTTVAPTINMPSVPIVPQQAILEMQPSSSAMPTADTMSDEQNQWLTNLPAEYLLLQLGSNIKADALEILGKRIRKNPELAHVITVKANGSTRYILVYGGFASREEAKQAADSVGNDLGVSPWIRRVADVKALLTKK